MNLAKSMERIEIAIKNRKHQMVTYDELKDASVKATHAKLQQDRINQFLAVVPAAYQGKTFADIREDYAGQVTVKNIVIRYADTFSERKKTGHNLIFSGKSGTGKTFISFILYQALAQDGYSVGYEPSLIFLRKLYDQQFAGASHFKKLLNIYQRIEFLILDECTESLVKGGELSNWEKEMFFTLINLRYQHNLSTLVITNGDRSLLRERLGERISSRLLEKGITLAFNWPSYR